MTDPYDDDDDFDVFLDEMSRLDEAEAEEEAQRESKAVVVTDGAFGKSLDELAELRAYRDKTEAALRELCANLDIATSVTRLSELGLWREPPKDGG